jgi:valyl-tRNA synthetase
MSITDTSEPTSADASAPDDFPAQYDPAATEPAIYKRWDDSGAFTADASRSNRIGGDRDPYAILLPPPNVTAILHVGHGLNATVQDVLVRWARMKGRETLWVPGTDHAGIATQNIIERQLADEGLTRQDRDASSSSSAPRSSWSAPGERSSSSCARWEPPPTGRGRPTPSAPS